MNIKDTRRYEMLLRVRAFGESRQALFPASSPGGQAFAALGAVTRRLSEHAVATQVTTGERQQQKKAAREALIEQLNTLASCAKVVARGEPGFDHRFQLSRRRSDQAVLTMARSFVKEAGAASRQFVGNGMPDTFFAELTALVEQCERAVDGWHAATVDYTQSRALIESALAEGTALVDRLDIFVANACRHDQAALTVWERERRVVRVRTARRGRRDGTVRVPDTGTGGDGAQESLSPEPKPDGDGQVVAAPVPVEPGPEVVRAPVSVLVREVA